MKIVRYAKLPISLDASAVQAELLAWGGQWTAHLNSYHYTGEWSVLPLRSPGGRHDNPVPELMGEDAFIDTVHMDRFPSVKKLLSSLACPILSVRFLNLKAGAVIKEHCDQQLALEQGEARLHFPVITHPHVEFYSEDDRIVLNEGECWYLNANLPHRVSNNSLTDRIHLIADCRANDWLKDLVFSASMIATKKEPVDPNMLAAIKHWRQQNTTESHKQADMLQALVDKIIQGD